MWEYIYIDDTIKDMALWVKALQEPHPKNERLNERLHLATMLQQAIGEQVATIIAYKYGNNRR